MESELTLDTLSQSSFSTFAYESCGFIEGMDGTEVEEDVFNTVKWVGELYRRKLISVSQVHKFFLRTFKKFNEHAI